jgi:hypothetical protein
MPMGTKQIETATVVGTITSVAGGNATVIVTGAYITGSPATVSVAVTLSDTASLVAGKIRPALALTGAIANQYVISGTGADVILTDQIARANDTTLNVSIDNGTCTGLTAAPTSTNTLAGSGITNGYCTLLDMKHHINSKGLTVDTVDDDVMELLIASASRYIDGQTNDRWYADTATHYFDTPHKTFDILFFDENLNSITSVTNGDGSTLLSTDYVLYPSNSYPKWGIQILANSGGGWLMTNGSPQQAISILGSWGNATIPDDIKSACIQIAFASYKRRTGENVAGKTIITGGGVVVMPEDVPGFAKDVINNHRRNAIG